MIFNKLSHAQNEMHSFTHDSVLLRLLQILIRSSTLLFSPVHTADADETKLSSLVASASAVCIALLFCDTVSPCLVQCSFWGTSTIG